MEFAKTGFSASKQQHILQPQPRGFASCDGAFGPAAWGCANGRFDFTLLFQQSIFAIIPSILLLLATPIRIAQLKGRARQVFASSFLYTKLFACVVSLSLQIVLAVLWASGGHYVPGNRTSLAAAALGIAGAVAVLVLSYFEHIRTVRPSSTLSLYLSFTCIAGVIRCRTLWMVGSVRPLALFSTAALVAKTVILCLELQRKGSTLIEKAASPGPEATSGILNRSMLWWLNSLLAGGYTTILSLTTLESLDPELHSQPLVERTINHWQRYRSTGKHALLRTLLWTLKGEILLGIAPRLIHSAFKISQPFLISKVIDYVQKQGTVNAYSTNFGFALIPATAFVYMGLAISYCVYNQTSFRMLTALRGCTVGLILHHSADLDSAAQKGSASLTLVTADSARINAAFEMVHDLWATPIEIGFALWLLARELGIGSVGPAIVVMFVMFITAKISKYMVPANRLFVMAVQKRVSSTSTVLGSMKETKMLGVVQPWTNALRDLMENQIAKAKMQRLIFACTIVLGTAPTRFAPVFTFGIALLFFGSSYSDQFTISTAFTSMTILSLLTSPLSWLMHAAPLFWGALSSFERIQNYIVLCEENVKHDLAAQKKYGHLPFDSENDTESGTLTPSSNIGDTVVAARDASVYFPASKEPVLCNVNMSIQPGSTNIVVGKVGSGKSVLLRCILGQVPTTGYMKTCDVGTAYCAQSPWVVNASIKANILGQSDMDKIWYYTVICACALDEDFLQLPDGDESLIGSKAMSLSGGQKARLSLARAIYAKKPVAIVDDVLSGLDWKTQRHVWNRVFGCNGLFRRTNTTVVLATHALHLVDDVDSIILLGDKRSGHVIQGTLEHLKAVTNLEDLLLSKHGRDTSEKSEQFSRDPTLPTIKKASINGTQGKNQKAYKSAHGSFDAYRYYLKAIGSPYVAILFGLTISTEFMSVFPGIWLKIWTEANERQPNVSSGFYFGIYTTGEIVGMFSMGVMVWFVLIKMSPRSLRNLHDNLLQAVMRAPLSFFVSTPQGDLLNRFSKDMNILSSALPVAIFNAISGTFQLLFATSLVLSGSRYLVAILPIMAVLLYGIQKFYLRTSRQMRHLDLESTAPLYSHLLETIEGASTIQAFGWQNAFRKAGLQFLDDSQKPHYYLLAIQCWLKLVLELVVGALATVLITLAIAIPEGTSVGAIGLSLMNVINLGWALVNIISAWTSLETSIGVVERLQSFEASTPQEPSVAMPYLPASSWPSSGRLELSGVTVSYSSGEDSESFKALDSVSTSIRPGQNVAVCGRTGSGKSTLLMALLRLLELDEGSIIVDDADISQIPQNELRSRFITVTQDPMLFPGSVRLNLCPEKTSSSEQNRESAAGESRAADELDEYAKACLKRVELLHIIEEKGGLDCDIADLNLSQGQKQLLCLARALMRKDSSSILLLDEAMSAVDQNAEALMVKILDEDFALHTVVSVVHRLNTVRRFDRIIMLDKGAVVEAGSPDELLARQGGRFQELYSGQNTHS